MSLTLNISKEAKLFYLNERKSRESSQHSDNIHPSTTIHMKKYSSPDNAKSFAKRYYQVANLSDSDGDRSSDEHLEERINRDDRVDNNMWMIPRNNNKSPGLKRKRSSLDNREWRNLETCKFSQNIPKAKSTSQKKYSYITPTHGMKSIKSHSPYDIIPTRDIDGENNSEEDSGIKDEVDIERITQIQNDPKHLDNLEKDRDSPEYQHISENNPFAKQRMLKSKYRSMHSY